MDREKTEKEIPIKISLPIKPHQYNMILQETLTAENDEVIVGIYQFLLLREETYIICCNRGNETLDYTRFAGSQKRAYVMYEEMVHEIEKDLKR